MEGTTQEEAWRSSEPRSFFAMGLSQRGAAGKGLMVYAQSASLGVVGAEILSTASIHQMPVGTQLSGRG